MLVRRSAKAANPRSSAAAVARQPGGYNGTPFDPALDLFPPNVANRVRKVGEKMCLATQRKRQILS
jgi:hypothetical protein